MSASQYSKKAILANALVLFKETYPKATKEQLTVINELQQQFLELNQQHQEIQDQCKKISRQIGEAKREGQPTDELLQTMQTESANIKCLKAQLTSASENILSHFDLATDTNKPAQETLPDRQHSVQAANDDPVSIKLLNEEHGDWNHYVESCPTTMLYYRTEWKDLIQQVFGHQCYYFYACDDKNKIVGVLPLVRLKSKLFGDFMVSMPYFNAGGAVADSLTIEQKLITAANKHANDLGVNHIEYRDNLNRADLPARNEKVTMILSLPDSETRLWGTFSAKLRSQIKRAQRETTRARLGNTECLDDFYTVFARNMRDLGTPVYSKAFFASILKTFPPHSKIVVIYLHDKPVATAFLLGHKDTLEIPWASTVRSVNHLSLNMLLYWEVLKFAVENKYQFFDFGRSSKGAGTFRFKQQWGAKPKQMYWHYWLPENEKLPELNPSNPKYALVINVWKRLPIFVTKWLGPFIVKNLP